MIVPDHRPKLGDPSRWCNSAARSSPFDKVLTSGGAGSDMCDIIGTRGLRASSGSACQRADGHHDATTTFTFPEQLQPHGRHHGPVLLASPDRVTPLTPRGCLPLGG